MRGASLFAHVHIVDTLAEDLSNLHRKINVSIAGGVEALHRRHVLGELARVAFTLAEGLVACEPRSATNAVRREGLLGQPPCEGACRQRHAVRECFAFSVCGTQFLACVCGADVFEEVPVARAIKEATACQAEAPHGVGVRRWRAGGKGEGFKVGAPRFAAVGRGAGCVCGSGCHAALLFAGIVGERFAVFVRGASLFAHVHIVDTLVEDLANLQRKSDVSITGGVKALHRRHVLGKVVRVAFALAEGMVSFVPNFAARGARREDLLRQPPCEGACLQTRAVRECFALRVSGTQFLARMCGADI